MSSSVYISAGSNGNPQQEDFVAAMQSYLTAQGLAPQTIGRNYFKNQQPLKAIADCMHACSGVVIIAFERLYVENGVERRGSPRQADLAGAKIPTVWNQIEGAMAYNLSLPMLVLVESGLRIEGMLESGYDWYVQKVALDRSTFLSSEFIGIFNDWKDRCLSHAPLSEQHQPAILDPVEMSVGKLLSLLRPGQLWATVVAACCALAAVAGVAFKLGSAVTGR